MRKIRYGVLGLGHIAQVAVLPAFANAKKNSELTALISGDPTKLKKLGRKYKVKNTFAEKDFLKCLDSGQIDALYIATPNTDHYAYAMEAISKGIHVLCEKPVVPTVAECQRLAHEIEKSDTRFMVAYRLHFDPANLKALSYARSKKLGDLKIFNSTFTMQVEDESNIRLDQEKAGGPLHDIGIYCINACRHLFSDEPIEVFAQAASTKGDKRFKEVPEMVSVLMKFPKDRIANFVCSFGAASTSRFDLIGTKGTLTLDQAYEYAEGMEMTVTINEKKKVSKFKKHDQFAPELLYFSDCILKNKKPEPSIHEGMADLQVIEAVEKSLREEKPVLVAQNKEVKGPSLEQEIRRPAINKPKTVNVTAPHS